MKTQTPPAALPSAAVSSAAGRSYQGQSTRQRRAQRRERLLAAATALYGSQGYRHSTVKAVCDAAGLTQRYFYEEFDSQESLLCAAYSAAMAQLRATLLPVWDTRQPLAQQIHGAVAAYLSHLHRHPQAARLILLEVDGVSERVNNVTAQELAALTQLLRRHLLGSLDTPTAPQADLDLLALGLLGAMGQLAKAWYTSPQPPSLEAVTAQVTLICLGAVHELQT